MNIGDTVFVRWYGKIVEGMIVENSEVTPLLASMVVVRIPVQGVRTSALYNPGHVYSSAELAGMKENVKVAPVVEAKIENKPVSEEWKRLQEFKQANWDAERNHIKLAALNDFYDLWRDYMATRMGMMIQTCDIPTMKMEAPATPEEAVQPIKPVLKRDTPSKPKLSKKQLQSTGTIDYGNVTQLSIF